MNVTEEATIYSYPIGDHRVDLLNVAYDNGYKAWEFSIWVAKDMTHRNYREIYMSAGEFSTPESAAAAGFTWLTKQGD